MNDNHNEELKITDPSANVLMLVGNAMGYIEKLMTLNQQLAEDKLKLAVEASQRERASESKRIDDRWKEDSRAVEVAGERAVKQAELLNAQMLNSAEVLRKSVEATSTALATQLQQITSQQNERIAALEKANYEAAGRTSVSPDLQELVTQLVAAQNVSKGAGGGMRELWGWIVGGIMFVIAVLTFWNNW